jgi:BirA family transcriptional regulator, biotin operon repressor / biotin---[acetyl-CoA-carboxylase] ligase
MERVLTSVAEALQARAYLRLRELDPRPPQLRWVETTASTNSDLLAAGVPPPEGAVLLAEEQDGGRGRLGRRWQSAPGGSLCLSLALPWPGGAATAPGASLVAGTGVAQALRALGVSEVGLKWPNDLWARERKLGGLLLELGGPSGRPFLVVGLGLNIALPEDFAPGQAWIDLARLGARIERVELACQLVIALRQHLCRLQDEGLQAQLPAWEALDCLRNRRVWMRAGDDACEGVVVGITKDGALRVQHAQGERVWHSAEASLRPA